MMRLCMIIYGSLDTLTGGFLYDKFLVGHLCRKGHKIDIVSLSWRRYGQHLLDNFSATLKSKLTENNYDLILQDELNHPSLFWINRNLKKPDGDGPPLVSIVHQVFSSQHHPWLLNRLFKTVEKIYLSSIDAFIFNSETTRRNVQHLINFTGPSIVACPGGDRLGHLRAAGQIWTRAVQTGPLKMVFVGNLTPIKGLIPLVEILATLPPTIWQLTVVGSLIMDPAYVRKVKRLISAKNMGQQLFLAGPLDGSALQNILSDSQLFVMPFCNEGFGIAYLEAMTYGLPVLASAAGAVKEFIRHGHNGFLFDPADAGAVAGIILDLYKNRDRLFKMSQTAMQTALSRPGWKEAMESIEHFLMELAKRRGKKD
jgi:glycosyltransferase involved in cell wall biosynthesis